MISYWGSGSDKTSAGLFASGVRLLLVLLCLLSLGAQACQPNTELEDVYCQLRHDYRSLPNLEDFRRNSPHIQRLLLKRPAAAEGIRLPEREQKARPARPKSDVVLLESRPASVATTPIAMKKTLRPPVSMSSQTSEQPCQLLPGQIICQETRFQLVLNQSNSTLAPGSLSERNRLNFPPQQRQSQNSYWTDSYRLYIEKMLSIGLGASTMSYTKFVYTWQQAQQQQQDPRQRFATMFEYLKRDKRSLSVQASYDDAQPEHLSWCQSLSQQLWVCDNRQRNWVFRVQ